jgi:hypothetical protein
LEKTVLSPLTYYDPVSRFNTKSGIKDGLGFRLLFSLALVTFVADKLRKTAIAFVYPLIKLYWFVGYLDNREA